MSASDYSISYSLHPGNGGVAVSRPSASPFFRTLVLTVIFSFALSFTACTFWNFQIQSQERDSLVASVQTVRATVTGCDTPGNYRNVRFHYEANGGTYDRPAWGEPLQRVGRDGLRDACAAGIVPLRFIGKQPTRWSVAPLSPLAAEDLTIATPVEKLVFGPFLLLVGVLFTWFTRRNRKPIV